MIEFNVLPDLMRLIPALSSDEFNQLTENCKKDGILQKLIVGQYNENGVLKTVLIDGHNRFNIAKKHNINYDVELKEFQSIDKIKEWMILNQFGRRNLSNYQRSVLALELKSVYDAEAKERQRLSGVNYGKGAEPAKVVQISAQPIKEPTKASEDKTRTKLADIAGVSHDTIQRVQKIQAAAKPELQERLAAGTVSVNEAYKEVRSQEAAKEKIQSLEKAKEATKDVVVKNIYNGDSRIILEQITDRIDAVLTDPPYGMNFISNRRTYTPKDEGIENDDDIETAKELIRSVFTILYNKMPENAPLFCFTGWKQEAEFIEIIKSIGFDVKNSIVWVKNNHGSGDIYGSFAPKHERIIYATKGRVKLNSRQPDVLNGSDIRTQHPTSKPIDLLKTLLLCTTLEGMTVCDPFAGHGSTGIACLETNRNSILIEYDENNYNQILLNTSNENRI